VQRAGPAREASRGEALSVPGARGTFARETVMGGPAITIQL
jgi:hypothetical protein